MNSKPLPALVRYIYRFVGVCVLVGVPVKGVAVIVDGEFRQPRSSNYRTGHTSEAYELHGLAAQVMGVGLVGIGLGTGYFLMFLAPRQGAWQVGLRDQVMLGVFLIGLALAIVSRMLPAGEETSLL